VHGVAFRGIFWSCKESIGQIERCFEYILQTRIINIATLTPQKYVAIQFSLQEYIHYYYFARIQPAYIYIHLIHLHQADQVNDFSKCRANSFHQSPERQPLSVCPRHLLTLTLKNRMKQSRSGQTNACGVIKLSFFHSFILPLIRPLRFAPSIWVSHRSP